MNATNTAIITALASSSLIFAGEEFNAVAHGQRVFESMGCVVCHATEKGDVSAKTGPNLHGVFLTEPHDVEVMHVASGKRRQVLADKAYFKRSVRQSANELVIAEQGPTKGQPYLAAMPSFSPELITNDDLESIWHYVRTLADPGQAGPAVVMMKRQQVGPARSLVEIADEMPVTNRTRVARARVVGMSGRALYVGLPGQLNYGFDPRFLSLRKVWTGGFLNLKEEHSGRGGRPSALGYGAKVVMDGEPLLAPLTANGVRVDFEFKETDVGDEEAIVKHLNDDVDFLTQLHALDAEYLGHRLMPWSGGGPLFRFRVGRNEFEESIQLLPTGGLMIVIRAKLATPQSFQLRADGLADVSVSGGALEHAEWKLPAADGWSSYVLTARLERLASEPILPVGVEENWQPQALSVAPAEAGRIAIKLPSGYRLLTWQAPLDLFGRKQMFEPTGIAVAKDGTIVLATRAAGVWRIRDGYWSLFAEGTYECLGVCIEDDRGDQIVVAQKPELTRMIDSDGDGRADQFDTVCDDYGFHADYHEYTHGPVRDAKGNYYFTLNLAHNGNQRASWRGGSKVMGSMGGYRGWACRVTPEGLFEPYAGGLRSPAGIGISPQGRLWYAENQGDYVGSSKWVPLEQGEFYGHVASLVSMPGMKPDAPELTPDKWLGKIRKGAVWLPQSRLCNSPGNPAWDLTDGRFGIFSGQVFIGDQTQSRLMRVVTEQVDGIDQGAVMPFAEGLASGPMRLCFLPDGSLLVGQTGRGWGSKGGQQCALQQVVWDGKTVSPDIFKVTSSPSGFDLRLTCPLDPKVSESDLLEKIKVESWYYINQPDYGSPEAELRSDSLDKVLVSDDRMTVSLQFAEFGVGGAWIDRIYQITWAGADAFFESAPYDSSLQTYFTLRAVPK